VLIVRHLGAEVYGQYAAVLAFGGMFVFIADLGLAPYAVRQVARWRDVPGGLELTKGLYADVLVLRILLAVVAAVLLVAAAWLTGRPPVMIGAIALGAVGLVMYGVEGASESMLAGFERLDLSSGAKVLQQTAFVLVGAAALWLAVGYYGLIVGNLIGIALLTWLCWRAASRLGLEPRGVMVRRWPALLRASIPFGVIGFTLGLSYKFDSVLLNLFRGDAETGYYNAAYSLVFSAVVLSNVVNTALYPSLTRQATVAPLLLPSIYERALRYLMVLALPLAAGVWALADPFVRLLFTASYAQAVPALQIVIWVVPLMFASEFLGYVVVIAGKEQRVARAVVISTGMNVVLNLVLVPRFGFVAAAVMTVVTEAVLVGQYVLLLRDQLRRVDLGRSLLRPALAAFLMGALLRVLPVPLPVAVALGAIAYGALLLVLGVAGYDEWRFIRGLRQPALSPTEG
jgi:O-antigen/teichoic acid export membrane protein